MMKKHQRTKMPDQLTRHPTVRLQGGGDKCATGAKTIRLPKGGTTIGIQNVCSLNACGKVQELIHELKCYRCYIMGLAKVRWTGFGETTSEEGHKSWYCGEDSKHLYGVAFIVWKEVILQAVSSAALPSPADSSPSGCQQVHTTSHSFLQVYAPTSDHEDKEGERFYEQLDSITADSQEDVVQSNWNARLGPDTYQH